MTPINIKNKINILKNTAILAVVLYAQVEEGLAALTRHIYDVHKINYN